MAIHKPTAELLKLTATIADPVERQKVAGEISVLRKQYVGTALEFKAPNGQASGLITSLGEDSGQLAWYAVRTPSFKSWFGDWERAARITEFENSQDVPLNGNAYQGNYELSRKSIKEYLKNNLSKIPLRNSAITEDIWLAGTGIKKLTSQVSMKDDIYKKLFVHIPEITEKSVFLDQESPYKSNPHYNKYSHLAGGLQIDGDPYTVHIVLGESGGQWYYSHILLHIEKGRLLNGIQQSEPGHPKIASLSEIKDTTLIRLLQADSSKTIDEFGEPKPMYQRLTPDEKVFPSPHEIYFVNNKDEKTELWSQLTTFYTSKEGSLPIILELNNNIKEKTMSDVQENAPAQEAPEEDRGLSPKELAFRDMNWQRTVIVNALKAGNLACLPGNDGYADTTPPTNLLTGDNYHSHNLLYLKEHVRQNQYPTSEYVAFSQITKARETNPDLLIQKGQKGVSLHVNEFDRDTKQWNEKHIRIFNIAQLNDPEKMRKWAEENRPKDYQQPQVDKKSPDIECSSTEPKEYLGQFLAAVSMGRQFKVSQDQAKEFSEKLENSVNERLGISPKTNEPVTDPFKLKKICLESSQYCKDFMKELRINERKQNNEKQQGLSL